MHLLKVITRHIEVCEDGRSCEEILASDTENDFFTSSSIFGSFDRNSTYPEVGFGDFGHFGNFGDFGNIGEFGNLSTGWREYFDKIRQLFFSSGQTAVRLTRINHLVH